MDISIAITLKVLLSERAEYELWHIGITTRPEERKQEHEEDGENVSEWEKWRARNLDEARRIEHDFIEKGMQGGVGGDIDEDQPIFVYIY